MKEPSFSPRDKPPTPRDTKKPKSTIKRKFQSAEEKADTATSSDLPPDLLHRQSKEEKPEAQASTSPGGTASRLRFSRTEVEELRGDTHDIPRWKKKALDKQGKLFRLEVKAEKSERKYNKALEKLPVKSHAKVTRALDPETGKKKTRLVFEQDIRKQGQGGALETAAKTAGVLAVGSSIFRDEEGQTGTQQEVQNDVVTAGGTVASVPSFLASSSRNRKYRKVAKRQKTAARTVVKYRYQEALRDNPKLAQSGFANRFLWKRRIKKQYGKELRTAQKNLVAAGNAVGFTARISRAASMIVAKSKTYILLIVAVLLLLAALGSCMSSALVVAQGMFSGVYLSSYLAEDTEISAADWHWLDMESALEKEIDDAEINHPGFDEYIYHLDGAIAHDPFMLASYLNTMYGDFLFASIKTEVEALFAEVYSLTFVEEIEVRTRTVTDDDGEEQEEEYNWYILHIKLDVTDFEAVIAPHLAGRTDGQGQYDLYIDTNGNHQRFGSPFNFPWRERISCLYGGRDNPTGANTGSSLADGREMHTGLDIGAATGTPIYSIMEGKVTFSGWHDLYGNYIDITDRGGNKSRYTHCSVLLMGVGEKVQRGQAIAESGATGNVTGPHLHIEIFLNGNRVNPMFLMEFAPSEAEEIGG